MTQVAIVIGVDDPSAAELLAHRELLSSRAHVVAVTLHLADGAQVVVEPCAFQMSEVAAVAKRVGAGS